MSGVVYRRIKGFPDYDVGNDGSVRSWKRGKPLVMKQNNHSIYIYKRVQLCRHGKRRDLYVHCLVAGAFLGERPSGMVIRHLNGKPWDNRAKNLEYGTPEQNEADKVEHGTALIGERNPNAKLANEHIRLAFAMKKSGASNKRIAFALKVSANYIGEVLAGRKRANVIRSVDQITNDEPCPF